MGEHTKLFACPFCGADAQIEHGSDHHGTWFNLGCSRHWGSGLVDADDGCIGGRIYYTETETPEAEAIAAWNTRAAPPAMDREAVDFLHHLRRVNTERYEAWVEGADAGIMFDALELGGEVGELLNVVKKLEREERGWRGSRADPADFADECADVLICLDKLARRRGVDLIAATIAKFNATSDKVGLPHKLSTLSADAIRQGEGFTWPEPKFVPIESGAKLNPERVEAVFQLINGEMVIGEQFQLIEMILEGTDYTIVPATPASHASDGGKA